MQRDLPPAPPRAAGQVRHTTATVHLAQQLYGDGDAWTPTQIRRLMEQRGIDPLPDLKTIRRWVIPGEADRWRTWNNGTRPTADTGPEACWNRLRALRAAGMSYTGCVVIAAVDFGVTLTPDQARYVIKAHRMTKAVRRHLTTGAA